MEQLLLKLRLKDAELSPLLSGAYKQFAHLGLLYTMVHVPPKSGSANKYNEIRALRYLLEHPDHPFDYSLFEDVVSAFTGGKASIKWKNVYVKMDDNYYFPIEAKFTEKALKNLFSRYAHLDKGEEKDFDDIFRFILEYLRIHPLLDGNGRSAMFLLQFLLVRFGLSLAPYLPIDALHNGLYQKKTFFLLRSSGGIYYGRREIDFGPYIDYMNDMLNQSYDLLGSAIARGSVDNPS